MQSKTVSVYKKILSVFLSVLLAFGCVTLALNSFCPRAKAANYGFTSASYGWATGKNDNNNVYNWTPYPYANSGWTTLLVAEIGNELYALASIGTDNLGAYRIEMAGSSGGAAKFQTEDVDTGNSSIIKNTYYWEGVYTNSTNQYVFFRPSSDSANLHCIKNDSTSLTSSYTGYYISSSYNSYLMDSNYNYIYFTFSGKNIGYLSTSGTNKVRAFYGNGTVQQVSLSYNGNGGSGSVATQYRLPGDVVTLSPNGFSRAGYTFTGWNTLANGTGTAYAPGDTITLNGNTTLYAQWSRDSFTVNYVARTGGSITGQTSESVSYGAKPSGTAYAASAGYAFDKWTQDSGTSAVTPANVVITAATTFYANFKTIPYTITYNLKSDETNDPANPSTYNVENSAIVLGDPSKPNYNFDHWEDQNGTPVSVIPAGSTGNITLTPVFTEKQYTIVYKANGGQGNDVSQTAGCASTVTLKDSGTFTRTGYNLVSWNTVSGGTGASYAPGSVQNALSSTHGATVELFAQWQAKDYTITYNMDPNAVTLDGAPSGVKYDGDYEFTVNVDPAYTVTDVTVTGVESFTFDPDTGVVTITNVTGDVVVDIESSLNEYDLTINGNGGYDSQITTGTVNYDGTFEFTIELDSAHNQTAPEVKLSNGTPLTPVSVNGDKYYYEIPNVTKDETVTVTTALNKYDVTFKVVDSETTSQVEHGTTPEAPDVSDYDKDGYHYTFTGWDKTIVTATQDAEYIAQFDSNAIVYTISYDLDGGSLPEGITNPATYTVEDSFNLNNPEKTGYVFTGWTGTELDSASDAVTVAAGSTGNRSYTATWDTAKDTAFTVEYWFMATDLATYDRDDAKTLTENGETGATVENAAYAAAFEGFTFNADASDASIVIAPDGSAVMQLYYTRNVYTLTTVSGTGITSTAGDGSYAYGAQASVSAGVATGYTWDKWTSDDIAGSASNEYSFTMPAKDVTLTANATINTYIITYVDKDGNIIKEVPATYGDEYAQTMRPEESDPSKNYSYENEPAEGDAITDDVIITVKTETKTFTITYVDEEGTVIYEKEVEYGDGYSEDMRPEESDPSKNYSYENEPAEGTVITSDVTVTVKTETKTFTVTFVDEDGAVLKTETLAYGETPSCDAPEKADDGQYSYTFSGWTPAVVPVTEEVTYTATYSSVEHTYKVVFITNGFGTLEGDTELDVPVSKTLDDVAYPVPVPDDGYDFIEWVVSEDGETGTVTVKAVFKIKQGDTEELSLIEKIIRIIQELFSFIAKMFGGNSSGSSGSSSSSGSSGSSSSSGSSGSSDAVYTYTGA